MLTYHATKSRLVYSDWMISWASHHSVKTCCYSSVSLAAISAYWCVCVSLYVCVWDGKVAHVPRNVILDWTKWGMMKGREFGWVPKRHSVVQMLSSLGNKTSGTVLVWWPWLAGFTHLLTLSQRHKIKHRVTQADWEVCLSYCRGSFIVCSPEQRNDQLFRVILFEWIALIYPYTQAVHKLIQVAFLSIICLSSLATDAWQIKGWINECRNIININASIQRVRAHQ